MPLFDITIGCVRRCRKQSRQPRRRRPASRCKAERVYSSCTPQTSCESSSAAFQRMSASDLRSPMVRFASQQRTAAGNRTSPTNSPQPSVFLTLIFTLLTPHSVLYSSLLTLHSPLSTLHSPLFTLHSSLLTPHSSLFTLHSSLLTPHSPLLTPHSSLHSPLSTPHSSLHSSLFTLKRKSLPLTGQALFDLDQSEIIYRSDRRERQRRGQPGYR